MLQDQYRKFFASGQLVVTLLLVPSVSLTISTTRKALDVHRRVVETAVSITVCPEAQNLYVSSSVCEIIGPKLRTPMRPQYHVRLWWPGVNSFEREDKAITGICCPFRGNVVWGVNRERDGSSYLVIKSSA
jgi:hypothetical protein